MIYHIYQELKLVKCVCMMTDEYIKLDMEIVCHTSRLVVHPISACGDCLNWVYLV